MAADRPGAPPDDARCEAILDFLATAQRLKDTHRSGRTGAGAPEGVAAHSWGVCLLAVLLERDLAPLDVGRLLKLCILHDLGEAISGDVPAPEQRPGHDRIRRERADLHTLTANLPPDLRDELRTLWDEYATGATREARLAKGIDKLETMMQHIGGAQAPGFDFLWNLGYARDRTDADPVLAALRRAVDARTRTRAAQDGTGG